MNQVVNDVMELPFFSIIIPTYERPRQLAACLCALAGLDYPRERFEVVVVDDGSVHSPEGVIEGVKGELDVRLLKQKNTGPAGARNLGAAHARGEFLAFTDDDCTPCANWLRAFASHFALTPDCLLLGGRTLNALPLNPYSETSQLIIEVVYAHYNANHDNARFFASNNFALSASCFHELKGFNESFTTSEDREFCDRWLTRGFRMRYAPEAIIHHAHDLTLRALWRQHFSYGRGALRFHRARSDNGHSGFKPDLNFYWKLLRAPASRVRKARAVQLTALLFWAQLANAAGFFYEKYHSESFYRGKQLPD